MNKIIFVLIILLIFIPLILVHNETFIVFNRDLPAYNKDAEACIGDKEFDPEYICNNTKSCCIDTITCYCNNPLLHNCLDNEVDCKKRFCKNMGKEECETFCTNRRHSCCKYLKTRSNNKNIDNKFKTQGKKYSRKNKCELSGTKVDKYKCGQLCYNDPNCTGYSVGLGSTICTLYDKSSKPVINWGSTYYARK